MSKVQFRPLNGSSGFLSQTPKPSMTQVVATPDELIDALQAGKAYDFVIVSKNIITSDPEITEEIRAHGQNPLVAFGPELEGASVAEVKATMFELGKCLGLDI
jgi:hypothetical protein